ncbi:hypothetical protein C8R46DRAFT_1221064 [Mycena filopes]|nr:hypothetical protein C8R46DRAFT_1221064 [Mycena filopes]
MSGQRDCPTFPDSRYFEGHVRIGKNIFGVHHGDPNFLLNLLSQPAAPSPAYNTLDAKFQQTAWMSEDSPQLLFVPRDNPFHGPLFGRLRLPPGGFPLEIKRTGWILNEVLQESWKDLEYALLHVLSAMMRAHHLRLSEGQIPHPPPRQYGYNCVYRSSDAANAVAIRARNAFLPLMAEITMYFIALDALAPLKAVPGQNPWRDQVIEYSGVHPQWFADLENSAVGDMRTPRVGGILDFTHRDDPALTRRHRLEWVLSLIMYRYPIPIYFYWGEIASTPSYPVPPALRQNCLCPDIHEISYLSALPGKVAFSAWREQRGHMESCRLSHPYRPPSVRSALPFTPQSAQSSVTMPTTPPSPADPPTDPPEPEKNSGQKRGEDPQSFFARRKTRNDELTRRETDQMRGKRLQREAAAATGAPPGKKGPSVFIWEEENGFYIRRSITRSEAADMWDAYTPAQRIYDGFHNQWDLCTALAPDEGPPENDMDNDAGPDDDVFPEASDIPNTLLPAEAPGPPETEKDLKRAHDLDDLEHGHVSNDDDGDSPYEPYHDISDIPRQRFGFCPPIAPSTYRTPVDRDTCYKALGDSKWPSLKAEYEHLPSLLAYLLHGVESINEIPRELLDLRQDDADISSLSNWVFSIHIEHLISSDDSELGRKKTYYVLRPTDPDPDDLYIVLSSAVTTLQIIRMGWGPDLREVVTHLVEYGIEFRLCIQEEPSNNPSPPRWTGYTGLGFRKQNYSATPVDYHVYQALRDNFLESPRGRLALQAGGIVGRLARFAVNTNVACLGPTQDALWTGVRLWDGESSMAYWDNLLTEDEINLICGVYEVGTGRVKKATDEKQTSQISWWPKPFVFATSGMNTGWWSADCEQWFLQRQAKIEAGVAKLHTSKDWKSSIRFFTQPRKIATANEKICAEFLKAKLLPT